MSKMKQTTLFSLKSWNKIAVEDILKYKEILNNNDVTEVLILKTLASLKKKNPNKDSILSSGLGSTLKHLENHSDPRVSSEVKMLIKHWKLEIGSQCNNIKVSKENLISKTCNSKRDIEIVKVNNVCKGSETVPVIYPGSAFNMPKIQPPDECMDKVPAKFEDTNKEVYKEPSIQHVLKNQNVKQVFKMQTPKQICKKVSMNESRKNELNKRLQFAIQVFMEEVGKQEVKLYLENLE